MILGEDKLEIIGEGTRFSLGLEIGDREGDGEDGWGSTGDVCPTVIQGDMAE